MYGNKTKSEPAFIFYTTASLFHPCPTDFSRKNFFRLKFQWFSSVNILHVSGALAPVENGL